MAEYIEKAELIKKLCFETAEGYYSPTIKTIKEFPAADVQPVKRGKWIEVTPKHSRCSVCDTTCLIAVYPISKGANYCPNCGSRMDGEKND